jgi:hypothetical protein
MHKRGLFAVAAVTIAAALAIAGCGSGGSSTTSPTTPATSPATVPNQAGANLNIFLVKGEVVTQVARESATPSVEGALNLLLNGPTEAEKAQGYDTAIPAGTKLLGYRVDGSKATADFSGEMASFGGGSARVQAIISQVDNTITSNDSNIESVAVTVEGKPAEEVLQP